MASIAPKPHIAFCASLSGSARLGSSVFSRSLCSKRFVRPVFASPGEIPSLVLRRWTPSCTAAKSEPAPSTKFGLISVLLFVNAMIWGLVLYPVMFVVDLYGKLTRRKMLDLQVTLMQVWMRLTIRSSFLRVRVENRERLPSAKRVLYVCNHQSPLDVFVSAFLLRRVRYLMPSRAFRIPLIGWMMSLAQWIPVEGMDRHAQMDTLKRAGEALKDTSLVVFPEGTPNAAGVLKEFPSIVFRAAQKADVIVAPVTIHGTGEMSGGKLGMPTRRPSEGILVSVHEPIEDVSLDVKEIAKLAFTSIRSALPRRLWGGS